MKPHRLEAFSDGVIAIIITIMVLELKAPHDATLSALFSLWPVFLSYVLSFLLLAIYWVNHHHLLHLAQKADGLTLWANTHLLFWLSLIPFVTSYLGETRAEPLAVAMYGGIQLACAVAFYFLRLSIVRQHRNDPAFMALNRRMIHKLYLAQSCYALSVLMAYVWVPLSLLCMSLPAMMYFMPDRNIEECGERG